MNDKMREQFEAWHRSIVEGEPPHEKYSDGSYVNPHVNRYWAGWQAFRETIVVGLPDELDINFGKTWSTAFNSALTQCRKAIEAQGLKVKAEEFATARRKVDG